MSELPAEPSLGRQDFGPVTVLRLGVPMLRGDEATEALFERAGALVEGAGRCRLVLDFEGVVYLASMALGKLIVLMRKARAAGGRLALCRVTPTIEEMLVLARLADILPMYGDEQEAVRAFA